MPIIAVKSLPKPAPPSDQPPPGEHSIDEIRNAYRFRGYKFRRDFDENILRSFKYPSQPEFWATRAVSYGGAKLWSP
jgi:hypothetical protein